jgi:hypothetical protein
VSIALRRAALGALTLVCAFGAAPSARADGDPASDTLLAQNAFYPFATPAGSPAATLLSRQIDAVYRHGDRIKVAVIQRAADLGSLPGLFNKPADYAAFLGQEIRYYYVGPLLVVMPNGFGIYDGGRSTAAESRVLSQARISGGAPEQVIQSATAAVTALLARDALRSADILAPFAYPVSGASGVRGGLVRMKYSTFDDSGRASTTIFVRSGASKQLAVFRVPLRAVAANRVEWVSWRSPKLAPPRLRFCVEGGDAAGNQSRQSCAAITLH